MQTAFEFDTACALDLGRRDCQEDALLSDFSADADVGLVILSDGMGGHAAGDVASSIVVSEVHAALARQKACAETFEATIVDQLHAAALAANGSIRDYVLKHPESEGMGATLVACAVVNGSLYWISIGDSPLFLYRGGRLQQLNEDHSLAPQIDFMVEAGLLNADDAAQHPDRNALTSVLFGADIPKIDCPKSPTPLRQGDIVVLASDGLQYLSDDELEAAVQQCSSENSQTITKELLSRVVALDDPDLDNVSVSVLKVNAPTGTRSLDQAKGRAHGLLQRFRGLVFDRA